MRFSIIIMPNINRKTVNVKYYENYCQNRCLLLLYGTAQSIGLSYVGEVKTQKITTKV